MIKYFFSLGNNPDLSQAELKSLFPEVKWFRFGTILVGDFVDKIDSKKLINVLGGTIKIGEIIQEFNLANRKALAQTIKSYTINLAQNSGGKKFSFGFSVYNKKIPGDFFKLGLAIKKDLKTLGISSRMVNSRQEALSSVIVEQNKLFLPNGIDFCLFSDHKRVFLGQTLVVQPFKVLSKRDFGRPARDDYSGMLPPKLAQIMINLARRNDDISTKTILDPFCGSGTVLSEAYLMGFKKIIGSDISAVAVADSQENLSWIQEFFNKKENNREVFVSDVLNLSSLLTNSSVDYIVSEPYLGPQRGFKNFNEVVSELNILYSQALAVFLKILKKGGRIVMIWPQFRAGNKIWKLNPDIFKLKPLISRGSLVYGRLGQKVWREIIVLER